MEKNIVLYLQVNKRKDVFLKFFFNDLDDGILYAHGRNNFGQTGIDPQESPMFFNSIQNVHSSLYAQIQSKKIIDIACSYGTNLLLLDDKTLRCWGKNLTKFLKKKFLQGLTLIRNVEQMLD